MDAFLGNLRPISYKFIEADTSLLGQWKMYYPQTGSAPELPLESVWYPLPMGI